MTVERLALCRFTELMQQQHRSWWQCDSKNKHQKQKQTKKTKAQKQTTQTRTKTKTSTAGRFSFGLTWRHLHIIEMEGQNQLATALQSKHSLAGQSGNVRTRLWPPVGRNWLGSRNLLLVDYNESPGSLSSWIHPKKPDSAWSNTIQPEWWDSQNWWKIGGERVKLRALMTDVTIW
jgi:hypothetical protein